MLHTEEWTYIKNYEPDRWPPGAPNVLIPGWGVFGDIDPSGIKSFLTENQNRANIKPFFEMCFGKVPAEELYNKNEDPDMIHNLAAKPEYQDKLNEFRKNLLNYLKETNDPRINGESPWDDYNLDKPAGEVVKD